MNRILLAAMAAVLFAGVAAAYDPCNPCPPKPCVTYKWITVCETIECEVPVTTYVEEPCEVQVTKMVPTQVECERMVTQTIYEEKTVPVMRTVYECEEYTVNVKKKEYRMETRTREVKRTVYDCIEEEVCKIVYDEVCDPCTGKITKVAREERVMVPKKVKRVVCEQEEYQVKVPYYVDCPVVKTRQVKKCVEDSKVVKVAKCIKVPEKYMKTVLKPVIETKTVMKKRKVCTTKTIEKQVTRRVKVPVEPEPVCPPAPGC
jgi:hypothetical protein